MNRLWNMIKALPWKDALKAAKQIIIPAAVGSGAAILAGCSALTPSAKTRFARREAIGLPERSEPRRGRKGPRR